MKNIHQPNAKIAWNNNLLAKKLPFLSLNFASRADGEGGGKMGTTDTSLKIYNLTNKQWLHDNNNNQS